jgi:hypothetical protein
MRKMYTELKVTLLEKRRQKYVERNHERSCLNDRKREAIWYCRR